MKAYFALSIVRGFGRAPLGNNNNPLIRVARTASTVSDELLVGAVVQAGPGNIIVTPLRKEDQARFNQDAMSLCVGYLYLPLKRTSLYTVTGLINNKNW